MANKKPPSLGRGLDAIFFDNTSGFDETSGGVNVIRVSDIEPREDQPRVKFDEASLDTLAQSIKDNGLLQPVVVRPAKNGSTYTIIAGERRWRAAKLAGLSEIPAVVTDADDKKAYQLALIENVMREDLNSIEEAQSYRRLLDEYSMKQEELAAMIGRSVPYISNTMRLLKLPDEISSLVRDGLLGAGHARALLGLEDKSDKSYHEAAAHIIDGELSVRETEALVKHLNAQYEKAKQAAKEDETEDTAPVLPEIDYAADLARRVTERLGYRVSLKSTKRRKTLEIEYADEDDLEALLEKILGGKLEE